MLIQLSLRWPFVRPHRCHSVALIPIASAHQSWVRTVDGKLGWLVRHDISGYTVALEDGSQRVLDSSQFTPEKR